MRRIAEVQRKDILALNTYIIDNSVKECKQYMVLIFMIAFQFGSFINV